MIITVAADLADERGKGCKTWGLAHLHLVLRMGRHGVGQAVYVGLRGKRGLHQNLRHS